MAFNFVANAAAITSLVGVTAEAASRGATVASQSGKRAVAIKDIKDLTGDSMLTSPSEKHNAMKKWVRKSDMLTGLHKLGGNISGFFRGVSDSLMRNLATTGFSVLTLASRNRTVKTVGIIGALTSMAIDFVKNGTNMFTDRNLIEK